MPYSGANDRKLPDHVKKLPADKRGRWVSVWNSVYSRCKEGGDSHKSCETRAFKAANASVSSEAIQSCILSYRCKYPNAREEDAILWCTDAYEQHVQAQESSGDKAMLEEVRADVLEEEPTPEERDRFAYVFSANAIPAPFDEHGVWSKNRRLYPPDAVDESFRRSVAYLEEGGVPTVFANHMSAATDKLPIGAVTQFYRKGEALRFRAGIVDTTEGRDVQKLLVSGVLKTVSLRSHEWDADWEEVEGHGECEVIKYAVINGVDFAINPALPDTSVTKEEVEMNLKDLTLAQLQESRPDLVAEIVEHQLPEPEVVEVLSDEVQLELAIVEASNTGIGSLVAEYLKEHCKSPDDIPEHIEAARAHALSELYKGRRPAGTSNKGVSGPAEPPEEEDVEPEDQLTEDEQEMVAIAKASGH